MSCFSYRHRNIVLDLACAVVPAMHFISYYNTQQNPHIISLSIHSFQQELPSRVFKMILKAADENNDGLISVQEVENLLSRIGAQDQLSKEEIETIHIREV